MLKCTPIKENITVYEGDDCTLQFKSSLGDITGYTVKLQARIDTSSRYAIIDVDGVILNATTGEYQVTLPSVETLGKSSEDAYYYDIKIVASGGSIHTDRSGMLTIEPRTTDLTTTKTTTIYGVDVDEEGVLLRAKAQQINFLGTGVKLTSNNQGGVDIEIDRTATAPTLALHFGGIYNELDDLTDAIPKPSENMQAIVIQPSEYYYHAVGGSWVRATDADEQSELDPLTQVGVLNGDHAGRVYKLTNTVAPVVDTDVQTWVVTSASSSAALDVSVDDGSFGVIAGTNAQAVLDSVDDQLVTTNLNVDALDTRLDNLSGVTGSDLGSFTGSVITDGSSVKTALQELEAKAEANAVIYDNNRFESVQTTLTQGNAITFTHAIGTKRLSGIKVYDTADEDITHTVTITLVDANSITVQNDDVDIDVFVVCAK